MEQSAAPHRDHTRNQAVESPAVARLRAFYEDFGVHALPEIPSVYAESVVFQDPVHRIEGLPALQAYFARTSANLTSCRFHFDTVHELPDSAAWISWRMDFAHPKLRQGAVISVDGVTHVRFDERITYHRDYFDLGSMLYEHVPVVGGAVRWLKGRLGE